MRLKSESEVAQSCLTVSDHTDCSLPGSSILGIFQARVLEWGAIAFSKQRDEVLLNPKARAHYIFEMRRDTSIDRVGVEKSI